MNMELLNAFKSLRWVDFFYYAILEPRSLGRQIHQREQHFMKISLLIPVFAAVVQVVCASLLSPQNHFFITKITYGLILEIILNLFFVFLFAWLIDTYLQLSGKNGNIRISLSVVSFSFLPVFFLLPLVSVFKITGFAPALFYYIAYAGLKIWSFFIVIKAISDIHGLTLPKAIAVCVIPFFVMGFFLFCSVFSGLAVLLGYLQSLNLFG